MSEHFVENQGACRGNDKLLTGLGIVSNVARFVSAHTAVFVGGSSSWNGCVERAHARLCTCAELICSAVLCR